MKNYNKIFLLTIFLFFAFCNINSYAEEVELEISAEAEKASQENNNFPENLNNNNTENKPENSEQKNEENEDKKNKSENAEFDGKNFFENNSFVKSLLFNEKEIEILYSTINAYVETGVIAPLNNNIAVPAENAGQGVADANQNAQPLANQATPQQTSDNELASLKEIKAETFYLKSIMNSEEDNRWTIWFNEIRRRSTEKEKFENYKTLKISKVTGNYVVFNLKEKYLDIINPEYQTKFIKIEKSDWDYKSKNGRVFVNSKKNKIKFKLYVNETFVMEGLKIKEGYFAPSNIKNPYYIDPATIQKNQAENIAGQNPTQYQSINTNPENMPNYGRRNPLNNLPGAINNRLPVPGVRN